MDKQQSWRTFFVALFAIAVLGVGFTYADPQWGPRDINLAAFGRQGYLNNTLLQNVNASGPVDMDSNFMYNVKPVVPNNLFLYAYSTTGTLVNLMGVDSVNDTSINSATGAGITIVQSGTAQFIRFFIADNEVFRFDSNGDFVPVTNNSKDVGTALKKIKTLHAVSTDIGHIQEQYDVITSYSYAIGDVVALDLTNPGKVKPVSAISDRIIGVVVELPRWVDDTYNVEVTINGTLFNLSKTRQVYIPTYGIAIYGKYTPVKVKGTIKVGDYLVASDTQGVATSMYNTAYPLFPTTLSASTDVNRYNLYAKMLPTLGIAMEEYNSASTGTIGVVIGK